MTSPLCSDGCARAEALHMPGNECANGCDAVCKPRPVTLRLAVDTAAAGAALADLGRAFEAAAPALATFAEDFRIAMREAALDQMALRYRAWGWACYLMPSWWAYRRIARECAA